MKRRMLAVAMAAALTAALAPTVVASTPVIPFTAVSTLVDIPNPGVEKTVGNTLHFHDIVLVYDQTATSDMIAGRMTVTVSFVFGGGKGTAMQGTEILEPTAYPGEGFTCSMSGGWDKDGVMQANDRCFGFGPHLAGWQFRSHISGESDVSGYLFYPGA